MSLWERIPLPKPEWLQALKKNGTCSNISEEADKFQKFVEQCDLVKEVLIEDEKTGKTTVKRMGDTEEIMVAFIQKELKHDVEVLMRTLFPSPVWLDVFCKGQENRVQIVGANRSKKENNAIHNAIVADTNGNSSSAENGDNFGFSGSKSQTPTNLNSKSQSPNASKSASMRQISNNNSGSRSPNSFSNSRMTASKNSKNSDPKSTSSDQFKSSRESKFFK